MLGEELQVPPPLAITDVRYVGEPIALVVAESRYVAEDASDLIEVDYDAAPAVVDFATAAADTEHVVHAAWGFPSNTMVQVPFTPLSPDLDATFAAAPHVSSARRAEPLRLRADGRPRDPGLLVDLDGTSSTSCVPRRRCTRPATTSPAISVSPKATCT